MSSSPMSGPNSSTRAATSRWKGPRRDIARALLAEDPEMTRLCVPGAGRRLYPQPLHLSGRRDECPHDRRRADRRGERGLPGLCPPADLPLPPCRPARTLRQRLPGQCDGEQRVPRLDRGVRAALRLARLRPDERRALHRAARPGRRSVATTPMSRRCAAPIGAAARRAWWWRCVAKRWTRRRG